MPCKCRKCERVCDCGEEYCEWHLIELDEEKSDQLGYDGDPWAYKGDPWA